VKFRVERDVLAEAVAWVARELPTRPVVPVLSGLRLEAQEDGLTLSCFDYEVSACAQVSAEVQETGTALVPGRLLAEITRSLPAAAAEVTSAAGLVMLTCGSAEFALVSLPLEDYPELPQLPAVAGTVDGGVLATAAAQVVPAASRDDTLPMLTGVRLDMDGDALTLVATDRYRLAVRTVDWQPAASADPADLAEPGEPANPAEPGEPADPAEPGEPADPAESAESADAAQSAGPGIRAAALVPARTLADVARTMGPGRPVTIALGRGGGDGTRPADGMISFEGGGRRLTARLIGGEFIRYESRFPAGFGASAELPAAQFTEAVRRVSLVAERATPVQLAFRQGSVVIEARSDGRARAVETVPAEFEGADQVISFSPHYLLDGLTAAALSEQGRPPADAEQTQAGGRIRLQFTSPAKPALITWIPAEAQHEPRDRNEAAADPARSPHGSSPRRIPAADSPPAFRYLVVALRVPPVAT
jgi:DNA polymerase-3 subunit beta